MTKDEALRLALEALEVANSLVDSYYLPKEKAWVPEIEEAITAIKAALEAKDEPVVWNEGVPAMLPKQKEGETFIVSYEPKLEAKDEPVAWRDAAIRLGEELSSVGPDGYYDMDAKEWVDWAMEQNPRGKHSLPQRTWIGLTAEEREQVQAESYGKVPHHVALIAAVEAKLKQKNFKE